MLMLTEHLMDRVGGGSFQEGVPCGVQANENVDIAPC